MALACQKRARVYNPSDDHDMPMEPTCSPARMLVLESPASKRARMSSAGQSAMEEGRGGVSRSPFQGCPEADAIGKSPCPSPP